MDSNTITSFVNGVGFPIAMCCLLVYGLKYTIDLFMNKLKEIEDSHKDQMCGVVEALDNTTKALNNNTLAFTKLYERLTQNESSN